jgi:hypothetical protein
MVWLFVLSFCAWLAFWFRVPILVMAYSAIVLWASTKSVVLLLVSLCPTLYVAVVVLLLYLRMKKPAYELFAFSKRLPFGVLIFDRVALGFIAPHKTLYGLTTIKFSEKELSVAFFGSHWLKNPFQSVDVGALAGIGEMVAFGASQYAIQKSGRRAIPIRVVCEFAKKSKGKLIASSKSIDPPVDATTATVVGEIRDSANDLCCTVKVELQLGAK